jgi:hypothetical protein
VATCAAGIAITAPDTLMMTPSVATVSAVLLMGIAVIRVRQAWAVLRYQRNIKGNPRYVMRSSRIPTSRAVLFLGRGFRWTQKHTERLTAARDKRAEAYLQPNRFKQWVRRQEIQWEHLPLLNTLTRWTASDTFWIPCARRRPPAAMPSFTVSASTLKPTCTCRSATE